MGKNILVIDDEKSIRNSFILTFEGSFYNIDTAESGKEGLEKIKENTYDLVFLDLKMPNMNGVEVLREIRKFNKQITVYLITAFHKEFFNELKIARDEGCEFELLNKPLNSEQLKQTVHSILEQI